MAPLEALKRWSNRVVWRKATPVTDQRHTSRMMRCISQENVGRQFVLLRQPHLRRHSLRLSKGAKNARNCGHRRIQLLTAARHRGANSVLYAPFFSEAPDFADLVRIFQVFDFGHSFDHE